MLVRLAKMKLPLSFGVYSLALGFFFGCANDPLGQPTISLDQVTVIAPPPYPSPPLDLDICPWETYIASSTNQCMFGHGKKTGLI